MAKVTRSIVIDSYVQYVEELVLPFHKLQSESVNKIPVILFYRGTFAPIHDGHINMMEKCKHYLESMAVQEVY